MIRNEAASSADGPGKFVYRDAMKTIEETILEVAASRGVLAATLRRAGPPDDLADATDWPSAKQISNFRKALKVTAPKGSEYGNTEVIYLKVRDRDRDRAVVLVEAAYHELRHGLGEIREARAQSMIGELSEAVSLADSELQRLTQQLADMEESIGSDLAELRMLDRSSNGGGQLSRVLAEVETEMRKLREVNSEKQDFLELLTAAGRDPQILVSAPSQWFKSQPLLLKLREGLIAAQLRTATLLGRLTEKYPSVKAARREEHAIRSDIFRELATASRAVKAELAANEGRQKILVQQKEDVSRRLNLLAGMRATYSNLSEQVQHRRELLENTQRDLSEARASRVAARSGSLVSRIGTPEVGIDPVGPSRAAIVFAGVVGGLLTGLGLVLLTAPPLPPSAGLDVAATQAVVRATDAHRTPGATVVLGESSETRRQQAERFQVA
jgi:uncharacterized protein involved in exopolysaccharide biosynthesis